MFNIHTQQLRDGKVIKEQYTHNLMTVQGGIYFLNVALVGKVLGQDAFQDFPLYEFYIDNAGYTGISRTDEFDSHPGWIEWKDYGRGESATFPNRRYSFGGALVNGGDFVTIGELLGLSNGFRTVAALKCAEVRGFGIIGTDSPSSGNDKDVFLFPLMTVAEYPEVFCVKPRDVIQTRYIIKLKE